MIKSAETFASRFWKDESGATLIEYSILIALITATLIVIVNAVGDEVLARWTTLNTTLGAAN